MFINKFDTKTAFNMKCFIFKEMYSEAHSGLCQMSTFCENS